MRATDKPFNIDKKQVYDAYKAVKSNKGAAGVDGQTIEQFEADLKSNLYKIWNRMSSGSYFPPPVRAVSIPKKSGGQRIFGCAHRSGSRGADGGHGIIYFTNH
jgi:RNA-directed DNA polymerase